MSTKKPIDYRQLSDELSTILGELQDGSLDIDQAVEKYEKAMAITAELKSYLTTVENKITIDPCLPPKIAPSTLTPTTPVTLSGLYGVTLTAPDRAAASNALTAASYEVDETCTRSA